MVSLSRFILAGSLVSVLVVVAGCSSSKADGKQGDLASAESDLKLSGTKYLGKLSSGQSKTLHYVAPPNYRSFGFDAKGGDEITVDVKSPDGDAVAWITDSSYNVLANNDDANENTFDSHVTYRVPASQAARSFRLVFREYGFDETDFTVSLKVMSAPASCTYDGQSYKAGDSFASDDGCNTCSCTETGQTACTKRACVCNPATETDRTYVGTPDQCMVIRYSCQVGQVPFSNACGCGCEKQ